MASINVSREANIPSWYSTMLLAMNALLLMKITSIKIQQRDRYRWSWMALTVGFVAMSLDEAAAFHEMLNYPLTQAAVFKDQLQWPWAVVGLPFVIALGAAFYSFLWSLSPLSRRQFVIAGGFFVMGSVVLEVFWSAYKVHASQDLAVSQLIRTVQEGMEMTGTSLFILALLAYIGRDMNGISLHIPSTAEKP